MGMRTRKLLFVLLCGIIVAGIAMMIISPADAETRWAMCKSYLNVRTGPSKNSPEIGRLDAGDEFETDGTVRDGFIRVCGVGEGEGWVFSGYTVDEQPIRTDERYVCVANSRAACRRWAGGPRIKGKAGWLYNGTDVKVYYRTEKWALTSRGYIASEWLERDPE